MRRIGLIVLIVILGVGVAIAALGQLPSRKKDPTLTVHTPSTTTTVALPTSATTIYIPPALPTTTTSTTAKPPRTVIVVRPTQPHR